MPDAKTPTLVMGINFAMRWFAACRDTFASTIRFRPTFSASAVKRAVVLPRAISSATPMARLNEPFSSGSFAADASVTTRSIECASTRMSRPAEEAGARSSRMWFWMSITVMAALRPIPLTAVWLETDCADTSTVERTEMSRLAISCPRIVTVWSRSTMPIATPISQDFIGFDLLAKVVDRSIVMSPCSPVPVAMMECVAACSKLITAWVL